jgi:hypothetical protein
MQRVMLLSCLVACATEASSPPPAELIGTWRYLPSAPERTPVEERQLVTFADDGTYEIAEPDGTQAGTFRYDDGELTITTGDGFIATGVAATETHLVIDALFPRGGADVAGTWVGTQSSPIATSTITLELRADGTAHLGQVGSFEADDEATWTLADPFAVLTFTSPTRSRSLPVLPGLAIGEWLYERI